LINYSKAIFVIIQNKECLNKRKYMERDAKIIPFRNIIECFLPTEKYEEGAKKMCSKKYQYPFFLSTVDRMFELYTAQDDERRMWVTCFNYLIKSTKEVQKIMSDNSKKLV
jgi:hypothetical protein